MTLSAGTKVGSYEIINPIGAGGMGEVYRARDTRLARHVALKVLPEALALDAERMARFKREARVLASLNHPNIASIYGLEESGKSCALAMELAEGPTLADRITAGAIPVQEALSTAKQICDAIEYAHDRGIVHRDLKPANIKIASDGAVKILDFGLAKALEGDPSQGTDISASPTISRMATQHGIILGTAAYMPPEQAKGKSVDRRADIWSFGCVLFEMLAGRMAFSGESVTDTLAAVIKEEPDWSLIPEPVPPRINELLGRCLRKDPKQRLQSIGDARITIEEALSGVGELTSSAAGKPAGAAPRWRVPPYALFIVAGLIAAVLAITYFGAPVAAPPALCLSIDPPHGAQFESAFSLSPDGTRLAFVATTSGKQLLWIRPLDSPEPRPLAGTEEGDFPFWSPDGKSIGFFASGRLKRIDLANGSIENLASVGDPRGGAWSADGTILFAPAINSTLMKIPAIGGTPSPATDFDPSRQERSDRWPSFLPDGRHFVFLEEGNADSPDAIAIGSLGSTSTQVISTMPTGSAALYADNHLIYSSGGFLVAQPFDKESLKLVGEPVRLAENVSPVGIYGPTGYLLASASASGLLVYRTNVPAMSQFTVVDRNGKKARTIGPLGTYETPALSPDQKRIVAAVADRGQSGFYTPLWLMDAATGASSRFTFDNFDDGSPIWSPDGRWIYFNSNRGGPYNIYRKKADGSADAELVVKSANIETPSDISSDNRFLLIEDFSPVTNRDLLYMSLEPGGKPKPYRATPATEADGRFSPDGRWVAYCSDENRGGDFEIFVSPFPPTKSKWQVSSEGGYWPMWSSDGRELYFLSGTTLMAAEVIPGATFQFRPPQALFSFHPAQGAAGQAHSGYFAMTGGKEFLLNELATSGDSPPITVLSNWTLNLKKK